MSLLNTQVNSNSIAEIKQIHFGGIGGCAVSALAQIAISQGITVTGTDIAESVYTKKLRDMGIPIFAEHRSENVEHVEMLVNSAAIKRDNPEIVGARKRNIPILKHSEFLGIIMRDHFGIAIAGTHGKTTTDALLGLVLAKAGLDPMVEVGGWVKEFNGNVRLGNGSLMVVEACEFDHSFLHLSPKIAVVLNIEEDHPDYYPDVETLKRAFIDFLNLVPDDGNIIISKNGRNIQDVLQKLKTKAEIITFGSENNADWQSVQIQSGVEGTRFTAYKNGGNRGEFLLKIPGKHNVQNALAVLAVVDSLGIDLTNAESVFASFSGVGRRYEAITRDRYTLVLDYAHHPSQIRATIEAARQNTTGRIITVFQPHTYLRTKYLFHEFTQAFSRSDITLIADTFIPAGRGDSPLEAYSSKALVKAIAKKQSDVHYTGSLKTTAKELTDIIREGDLVLILGAGDIYTLRNLI